MNQAHSLITATITTLLMNGTMTAETDMSASIAMQTHQDHYHLQVQMIRMLPLRTVIVQPALQA